MGLTLPLRMNGEQRAESARKQRGRCEKLGDVAHLGKGPGPVPCLVVFMVISGDCLGLDSRRPSSPLIDIKPIEFGVFSAKKEPIQPSVLRRTYTPDDYFRKFEPRLYSLDPHGDDVDFLTDEEILSRYQLGMLHFSTQYDLLHNHLTVRVIEARDLPPPIAQDGSRQDMAHSNPYVKICLLPDQKNSKQTGVKRKTQKPVFEERYTFEIPFLEAQRRTLLLTVLDFDKFSRHCVIGKVSVPLCEVDLVKGGHWWKALIPSSQVRGAGMCLLLGVCGLFFMRIFILKNCFGP